MNVTIYGRTDRVVTLPSKWAICDACRGEGKVCSPSIGVITAEEWERDWDEDERAFYRAGGYDIPCRPCSGSGKVLIVDESKFTRNDRRWYRIWSRQEADIQETYRIQESERRYGA